MNQYERLKHEYILTDENGNIACVSEGLNRWAGLSSKFFKSTDSFQERFNIDLIFGAGTSSSPEMAQKLSSDGGGGLEM